MKNLFSIFTIAILSLSMSSQGYAQFGSGAASNGPAAETATPTLHVIIVSDPKAGGEQIMECVTNTVAFHTDMLNKVEETLEGELKVKTHTLTGDNWGGTAVIKACQDLNVQPNDAVYFMYNGHGFRTNTLDQYENKWPALCLQKAADGTYDDLKLSNIFQTLEEKNPRLLIVISESCNYPAEWRGTPHDRGLFRKQMCQDLFINSKGKYLASGCGPGKITWAPWSGCVYTQRLMENIGKTLEANEYSEKTSGWNAIFTEASKPFVVEFVNGSRRDQAPQFEKNPVINN